MLVFVVIGRANHHAGGALAGLWYTFWPFAAGRGGRRLVGPGWAPATALMPTGVGVWLVTVAVGKALRVLAGQGTAFAFIIVALVFLGLFLLGWRLVWRWASTRTVRLPDRSAR